MKKLPFFVIILTTLMLFALMNSCSETVLPTENTLQSENTNVQMRSPLYRVSSAPLEYELFADEDMDVGKVTISNDDVNLFVTYVIEDLDWCITETHVEVAIYDGVDPVWPGKSTNKQGNPSPGQFTKSMHHDCVYTYTETIAIPPGDHENLAVAAHAKIKKVEDVVVPDCWESVWQIGYEEEPKWNSDADATWLTNYADEFNWAPPAGEFTFGPNLSSPPAYVNPFIIGTHTNADFPWNSKPTYADNFDIEWNGSLPFGGRLTLSWSPGRINLSNLEHKEVWHLGSEIADFQYTTVTMGDPAFWHTGVRLALVEDVVLIPTLADGLHAINLRHLAGQGTLWDWVRLEQPCTETIYESAWAAGLRFVDKGNWATWVDYELTCEEVVWDITGDDWAFLFSLGTSTYPHSIDILVLDQNGDFLATGLALNDNPQNPWHGSGTVAGNAFTLEIDYDNTGYSANISGTIAGDGTLSGGWIGSPGQAGTWVSTSGAAEEICKQDLPVDLPE